MKLYTEEQVRELADMVDGYRTDELMASLTPIELPTWDDVRKAIELARDCESDCGGVYFMEGTTEQIIEQLKNKINLEN